MNVTAKPQNALPWARASLKKIDVSTITIFGRRDYRNPAKTAIPKQSWRSIFLINERNCLIYWWKAELRAFKWNTKWGTRFIGNRSLLEVLKWFNWISRATVTSFAIYFFIPQCLSPHHNPVFYKDTWSQFAINLYKKLSIFVHTRTIEHYGRT